MNRLIIIVFLLMSLASNNEAETLPAKENEEFAKIYAEEVLPAAKEIFSRADSFLEKRDYENARFEFEKLKKLPVYGRELALFNIAGSYRLEKDYDGAHRTYNEIMAIDNLAINYRVYGLFRQAEVCMEQKDYSRARQLYENIIKTEGIPGHHLFAAFLKTGDSYRVERKYSAAREIYERLLRAEESSVYPHEGYRADLRKRLEAIESLAEGAMEKSRRQKWAEWIESPKRSIYVSLQGSDINPGTKEKPFMTMKRAQAEVRRLKDEGMPPGGIVVYLRDGIYFMKESFVLGKEDSGMDGAPVVYRSYPGENVRIAGGQKVDNFKPLNDPGIMRKLPEEARGKIWVAELKDAGITDYGQILNRGGTGPANPSAMELFFNGRPMKLARWPNEGHARVAGITAVDGEMRGRGPYQFRKFMYSGDRPEKWLEEKEVWLHGFWYMPFAKYHVQVESIDTGSKTISLALDKRFSENYILSKTRVKKDAPYYAYNILCELDAPGEWYVDRDTGKLYFYPPGRMEGSEIIVSTLDASLVSADNASNIVFYGLTFEVTRRNAIEINNGRNNLIAKSIIRNTGQSGVIIKNGWEHKVVGCDIYDNGEGGIYIDGGDRFKLIPSRHIVENNHIYRFNRFDGGYCQAVKIDGVGQSISHNVIHDSPLQAIHFNANDHVMEFNEIHDVVHEGRELGALYIYGAGYKWVFLNRGHVIRNNFFHHITLHSSPNLTHGLRAIHFDAINGGEVVENNIFYRVTDGIANTYPDNRLENNIFVDAGNRAIGLSNRSGLFLSAAGEPQPSLAHLLEKLPLVRYKQPPWSCRYPQLPGVLSDKTPVGWARNNIVERNLNTGGPFLQIGRGLQTGNKINNNWDGEDPLFVDRAEMDFRIREGSPAFGITGFSPIPFEKMGVYEDGLRASWPIERRPEDIGKYYRSDSGSEAGSKAGMKTVVRISPPLNYAVSRRKTPVTIDGKLEKEEWLGLDKKMAMVIERYYTGEDKKGPKTYAWLLYDKEYLYIATMHEPDMLNDNVSAHARNHLPAFEVAIESQSGAHSSGWWMEDMQTGPIYVIWGYYDGKLEVKNNFKMPFNSVRGLEKSIEYRQTVLDRETQSWISEMKIPLGRMGLNPAEVDRLAFNIGAWKRNGWYAWVPTGDSVWRVENGGFITFPRDGM